MTLTYAELPVTITLAERRVLELAGTSTLCAKELAERLQCSASSVKQHLHHIYRKMGWHGPRSRIKLLQWCLARQNGRHDAKQQ